MSLRPVTLIVNGRRHDLRLDVRITLPGRAASAETEHRIKLGASRSGRFQALVHESWDLSSRADPLALAGTEVTARMYAVPNIRTRVHNTQADRNTPGFMRSPLEVPYMFALECAVDELAVQLKIDPVELRRINDAQMEPVKGIPYSSRNLNRCFAEAGTAFGWRARTPEPGSMRDGDWLVGWGCAASIYPTWLGPATARVILTAAGEARVETVAHEIGTGILTVMARFTAERLGIPPERVTVHGGDSGKSPAPVAGGACTTASVCAALAKACDGILAQLGNAMPASLPDALARLGVSEVEQYAEYAPKGTFNGIPGLHGGKLDIVFGMGGEDFVRAAFGAEFIDLRVYRRTREIRVARTVAAFASGRIINPRTAHSQLMGGLIWGIGSALHEATEVDMAEARYTNNNMAEYLIPVNADVAEVEVIFVPEDDRNVNELGIKGLGELATVGTNAAVANAVHHATGKRVRRLPIRVDQLLD